MKHLINKLKNIWNDESAQGATEYILLLVVVVALVIAFKGKIMTAISSKTEQVGSDIQNFNGN